MTAALRRVALSILLLLSALPDAAASGFYDTLNDLRAGLKGCPRTSRAPAFVPRPELERVARNLARGGNPQASMKQSGYRAIRSYAIHLEGSRVRADAASVIVKKGYCRQLQDPELRDAGYYLHEDKLWIVLAQPFAPPPGLNGPAAGQRVERAGYRYRVTGENIAGGPQMTSEAAVAGWIKSPSHCANLMNPAFTEMGAAYAINAKSELGVYWAQEFGKPR